MKYLYIDDDQQLVKFCAVAATMEFVALDTEFVRTRTFFPQCGLIQIYDGNQVVLVDPLVINDWQPLVALLENQSVVKVLHSCSEDLEVFQHLLGTMPTPLFDSQFAACMLNMGNTLGYAKLIEAMLDISLDKGESRTDWLQRPLSPEQLKYAANDVIYLHLVYPQLKANLEAAGRFDWVLQEGASLADKKRHLLPGPYRFLSVKNSWQLRNRPLLALKMLADWRYQTAIKNDSALNFVIKEACMLELARKLPSTPSALSGIGCLSGKEIRLYGDTILSMVSQAKKIADEHLPNPIQRLIDVRAYKKISQNIRAECIEVAERENIPLEVLASKKQINQLLKWLWFDEEECKAQNIRPDLITGWRAAVLRSVTEPLVAQNERDN